MSSLKSKVIIFTIQNRNLFKGSLKREVITTGNIHAEASQGT